jgi:hypothetical protein
LSIEEEIGNSWHNIRLHRRDECQIHGYIEDGNLYPADLLHEGVVEQLKIEEAGSAFVTMLIHVIEGKP